MADFDLQTDSPAQTASRVERCVVVIPCYNEAERLQSQLFSEFIDLNHRIEFLFVNDGSSDGTLPLLMDLQAKHPHHVHVLNRQPNAGKAEAVRIGMLNAIELEGVTVTGFWDADLATPLSVIPEFLLRFAENPRLEIIFGARVRLLGHAIHRKPIRHYLGRCFATVVSVMLALPVYDTQCGAKLFRTTTDLGAVLASPFQSRWIFDVEILARFMARRERDAYFESSAIYENPLPQWQDIDGSKIGPLDFIAAVGDLIKIYRLRK